MTDYSRERYVKTAQQSYVDDKGVLRSGILPVLDGGGNPIYVDGEIKVDHAWGSTLPPQPNEDRGYGWDDFGGGYGDNGWNETTYIQSMPMGTMDNHDQIFTEYQGFPAYDPPQAVFAGVGENYSDVWEVVGGSGRSYDNGDSFMAPSILFCYSNEFESLKLKNVKQTLIDCGADATLLKDFTFSGGTSPHDHTATPNYDGSIFWYYIAPNEEVFVDWLGVQKFGRDLDQVVVYFEYSPGQDVPTAAGGAQWYDYAMVVLQCSNPDNNTAIWWD